jgi:hypothetical protein
MKLRLYKSFGALNSPPVFAAFEQGAISLGHEIVDDNEDVAVIWSVLWQGRMANNQHVYRKCVLNNTPIVIIEVGNLIRGETWRICQNHINNLGIFGNTENLDPKRPEKLGILLQPENLQRRNEILIAGQHSGSLQWEGQSSMEMWAKEMIYKIQNYTDRKVVVRPHPRSNFQMNLPGVTVETPRKIPNTYDGFDIDYNYHCVINYNSGPAVQAAINGTPIICDPSSLAWPVSEKWENLENPSLPDREEWFIKLCHTEWTVDEISRGVPLKRLEQPLLENLKNKA